MADLAAAGRGDSARFGPKERQDVDIPIKGVEAERTLNYLPEKPLAGNCSTCLRAASTSGRWNAGMSPCIRFIPSKPARRGSSASACLPSPAKLAPSKLCA